MFCSKCGKTLKPDEPNCPSCGAVVGDSRFEGNGYTAAQARFVSSESDEVARKAVPYTRTTYTTSVEEGGAGDGDGDVYSRTTYRPILEDDQPAPAAEPEQAADGEDGAGDERAETDEDGKPMTRAERAGRTEKHAEQPVIHKRATLPVHEAGDDEDPDADIEIAPLRPIKKAGISPEVQQYMERLGQGQVKPKKSLKALFGAQPTGQEGDVDADGADGEPNAADPLGVIREGAPEDIAVNPDGSVSLRGGVPAWLKPLAIIACIAIILAVAVWALLNFFANDSQLDGVGFDLRDKGLKLIQSKADPVFRTEMVKLMQSDTTNQTMSAELAKAHEEIAALMPENPMKNDALFISALDHVQDTIDRAVSAEALAVLNKNDTSGLGDTLSEQAQSAWDDVINSITRLESAKEEAELRGIIEGAIAALATPEPTAAPTATPSTKTLRRGLNNNANVKKLQQRLKELGWFKGTVDADYGMVTEVSVKAFQEAAGITPADGITDRNTWDAIMAEDAITSNQAKEQSSLNSTPTLAPAS